MPRKRAPAGDADASRPKQLRKRLRKAEDQLADAVTKRDRAQARVEALSIIADEVRTQLAEAEQAAAVAATPVATAKSPRKAGAPSGAAAKPASTATRKRASTAARKRPTTTPAEASAHSRRRSSGTPRPRRPGPSGASPGSASPEG